MPAVDVNGGGGPPPGPARPLRAGEILNAAVGLYRRNPREIWKIVAVIVVPLAVIQQVITAASLPAGIHVHNGTLQASSGAAAGSSAGLIAEIALSFIGLVMVNGALALCLVDSYLGRALSWSQALEATRRRLAPLLWVAIIGGIAAAVAFVVLIVPGIWLAVMWAVAVPAVMLEPVNGLQALARSAALVRGRWWATFGVLLLALVMLLAVQLAIALIVSAIESGLRVDSLTVVLALSAVQFVIASLIIYPLVGGVIAVLYVDLRMRRDGVDIERLAERSARLR